jgi:AraC-like DNA-binding protein
MEQLTGSSSTDAISELLRAVRVRSTVFCRSSLGAPWGWSVEPRGHGTFHFVTEGACWLEVEGVDAQAQLAPGDLAVLPTGVRHWLRDDPASPTPSLDDVLRESPPDERLRMSHGGDGPRTTLLCGGFALEGGSSHPVLRTLPPVIHVRGASGRPEPWVASMLELVRAETASDAPGATEVVGRLADALVTQAVRMALLELDRAESGQLPLVQDPLVARAIELVHHRPERAWTVGELAGEVALSRSAFAARFRKHVGESPRRYANRARLALAARLLETTDATVAEIALRVGYENEFSFSRAFKRAFGLAPGTYRGRLAGPEAAIEIAEAVAGSSS